MEVFEFKSSVFKECGIPLNDACERCVLKKKQKCICTALGAYYNCAVSGENEEKKDHRLPASVTLPELLRTKEDLNTVKSQLDDVDIQLWKKHTTMVDPTSLVIKTLKSMTNEEQGFDVLSRAWCKLYEILAHSNLLATSTQHPIFKSLHLCECPGGFIGATNHYLKSIGGGRLDWRGLSLNPYFEGNDLHTMIDDDVFYRETSSRWIRGADDSGNIVSRYNINFLWTHTSHAKPPFMASLVTADGAFDSQHDANEQEAITASLHFAELVCALGALAVGGHLVLKMFTLFESSSFGVLAICSWCFEKLRICKPRMSRPANSEVYLVASNFRGISLMLLRCLSRVVGEEGEEVFCEDWVGERFRAEYVCVGKKFALMQLGAIERNLRLFLEKDSVKGSDIRREKERFAKKYVSDLKIKPLRNKDRVAAKHTLINPEAVSSSSGTGVSRTKSRIRGLASQAHRKLTYEENKNLQKNRDIIFKEAEKKKKNQTENFLSLKLNRKFNITKNQKPSTKAKKLFPPNLVCHHYDWNPESGETTRGFGSGSVRVSGIGYDPLVLKMHGSGAAEKAFVASLVADIKKLNYTPHQNAGWLALAPSLQPTKIRQSPFSDALVFEETLKLRTDFFKLPPADDLAHGRFGWGDCVAVLEGVFTLGGENPGEKQENPGEKQENPGEKQENRGEKQENPGEKQENLDCKLDNTISLAVVEFAFLVVNNFKEEIRHKFANFIQIGFSPMRTQGPLNIFKNLNIPGLLLSTAKEAHPHYLLDFHAPLETQPVAPKTHFLYVDCVGSQNSIELCGIELAIKRQLVFGLYQGLLHLETGGSLVVKMTTSLTRFTAGLLCILSLAFESLRFEKSARPIIQNRFLICSNCLPPHYSDILCFFEKLWSSSKDFLSPNNISLIQVVPPIFFTAPVFSHWLRDANDYQLELQIEHLKNRLNGENLLYEDAAKIVEKMLVERQDIRCLLEPGGGNVDFEGTYKRDTQNSDNNDSSQKMRILKQLPSTPHTNDCNWNEVVPEEPVFWV